MQAEKASKVATKLCLKWHACINSLVGQMKRNRAKGTKKVQMGKIDAKRTHHSEKVPLHETTTSN